MRPCRYLSLPKPAAPTAFSVADRCALSALKHVFLRDTVSRISVLGLNIAPGLAALDAKFTVKEAERRQLMCSFQDFPGEYRVGRMGLERLGVSSVGAGD